MATFNQTRSCCRFPTRTSKFAVLVDTGLLADPWRITVNVAGMGMTGFEVEELLQREFLVYPELSTHQVHLTYFQSSQHC